MLLKLDFLLSLSKSWKHLRRFFTFEYPPNELLVDFSECLSSRFMLRVKLFGRLFNNTSDGRNKLQQMYETVQ